MLTFGNGQTANRELRLMSSSLQNLKTEILRLTREYSALAHASQRPGWSEKKPAFIPGETPIPYAGRVFDEEEVEAAVSSALDFWLTLGPEGEAFENELANFLGVKHSLLVNSGSSANLLALSALTSPKIPDRKRLHPGDEIITCAAGFPTTVAPILQNGLVPVFIDNDPVTGNARVDQLTSAFHEGKTKAVMLAHTLGNPFDLGSVLRFCRQHDLWLIEDNCDSLGSTYTMPLAMAKELGFTQNSPGIVADGKNVTRYTGTWGDLSTQSFYPPHHITMGEGGAVNIVSHPPLKKLVESFRDWGRDCWCASGKDNTCGKRFGWRLGELPEGYDHKYIYSHLGYNLKPLDLQAGIGRCQLRKLKSFIEARKQNWEILRGGLADLEGVFTFMLPTHTSAWINLGESSEIPPRSGQSSAVTSDHSSVFHGDSSGCIAEPSWFGFMMRVHPEAKFTASELASHLDENKIGNRMLFGGNLLRQPVFVQLRKERSQSFRVVGQSSSQPLDDKSLKILLAGADEIMGQALFLGVYPGLSKAQIKHAIEQIKVFVASKS